MHTTSWIQVTSKYDTILYKGLENPWNLLSTEVIDPGLGKNDSV